MVNSLLALGADVFYTGEPLRNKLLGKTFQHEYEHLLVSNITAEDIRAVAETLSLKINSFSKEEINVDGFRIQIITSPQDIYNRLDFTINLICMDAVTGTVYDPFGGIDDLNASLLRAKKEIFLNDPIKMVSACRLTVELGFELAIETWFDIYENARIIKHANPHAIGSEFIKIFEYSLSSKALRLMHELRLMQFIIPELSACSSVVQSKREGVSNVLEHILYTIDAATAPHLKMVMLFHDIAKPLTLSISDEGTIHFFKHEVIGATIAKMYLKKWGFIKEEIDKITHLIAQHMFDADPKMTAKGIRRLIKKVGEEHIYDLLLVREADRSGSAKPVSMKKLRLLKRKIENELHNINTEHINSNTNSGNNIPQQGVDQNNGGLQKTAESEEIV